MWVGYPGQRVPMEPPTTPISVAGGTYPATIWGKYMKVAKKGCGDFAKPKHAFQSKPFTGKYQQIQPKPKADEEDKDKDKKDKDGDKTTETPAPNGGAAPQAPQEQPQGGAQPQPQQGQQPQQQPAAPAAPQDQGGAGFDPEQYQAPG